MNEDWEDPDDVERIWSAESDQYEVLALDPGGTTGWSLFGIHPDAMSGDPELHPFGPYGNVLFWTAGEFTGNQDHQIDQILELVDVWPLARLVTEDFKLRQLNAELDPVEINAILRRAVRPRYWIKQPAALALKSETDDRLKAAGFWIPGQEHARDAVRHNITFIKRQKERAVLSARRLGGRVPSP